MNLRQWAAATAAGTLLVICLPGAAVASEPDDCADAGLISSLLGSCGLLGGLLGGSDPAGEDPDPVDTPPGDAGDSDGTAPPGDTSGTTGPQDSTSAIPPGSSSYPDTSTGTGLRGAPAEGTAGPTGPFPVAPSPAGSSLPPSGGSGTSAERAQSTSFVPPSRAVGPLVQLPPPPRSVGADEDFTEAAAVPQVPGTRPVVGVALILITAGIFVAITGLWVAIWRNAGRAET